MSTNCDNKEGVHMVKQTSTDWC